MTLPHHRIPKHSLSGSGRNRRVYRQQNSDTMEIDLLCKEYEVQRQALQSPMVRQRMTRTRQSMRLSLHTGHCLRNGGYCNGCPDMGNSSTNELDKSLQGRIPNCKWNGQQEKAVRNNWKCSRYSNGFIGTDKTEGIFIFDSGEVCIRDYRYWEHGGTSAEEAAFKASLADVTIAYELANSINLSANTTAGSDACWG